MKALVTQELVNEAADALAASGDDPTILTVQEHLGFGSYTTVKRYLDVWKTNRAAQRPQVVELPTEIAARGQALLQELWRMASDLADRRVTQIRAEAAEQVGGAQTALSAAETTIARLEAQSEQQAQTISEQTVAIDKLLLDRAEQLHAVQVAEARLTEQAQRGDDLRRELDQAHAQLVRLNEELAQARATALELARVTGERDALRTQLQEQTALIARLTRRTE